MPKSRIVVIDIQKSTVGYRAHCWDCKRAVTNQHADWRQARKAGERHANTKHPNQTAAFTGKL